MYLNRRLFRTALRITFRERPFSVRRWGVTLGVGAVYVSLRALNSLARGLDRLFCPDFAQQPLRAPVFIAGAPRSGTTYMQFLLALDEERFSHVKLYHTVFPSVLLVRGVQCLGALDRKLGGPVARGVGWIERRLFRGWRDMHPMQFSRPEEDEGFLFWIFVSEAIFLLFPYIDALREVAFPDELPSDERRAYMRYYRSTLQRHLHATGPEKMLLSKSTSFGGRVRSMIEAFPDARIVHMVRHPYECLPSHVSVFRPAWRVHSPDIASDPATSRAYADVAVSWMRAMYEAHNKLDEERYICILYSDLVADPAAVIDRIYRHFGFEPGDAFRARLHEAIERSRRYQSEHLYSLEEFGLSRAWVQERLGDVMDAHGFEP
jgi:omega-hydroxy-beta-dihydromenaquinone-9 sulfotransferase